MLQKKPEKKLTMVGAEFEEGNAGASIRRF